MMLCQMSVWVYVHRKQCENALLQYVSVYNYTMCLYQLLTQQFRKEKKNECLKSNSFFLNVSLFFLTILLPDSELRRWVWPVRLVCEPPGGRGRRGPPSWWQELYYQCGILE